ncbi:MAG: hypothetical protein GEU97_09505 [Actinophytocola sp.]|nr:hypothetical protein [Actinophytocola sp.]
MSKEMAGDNRQRRQRARQARKEYGVAPSRSEVTLGASKSREHLPGKTSHEQRKHSAQRGKQRSDVDSGPQRRG